MIKNRDELLSHGFIEGREKAIDIMEYALEKVDPYKATKKYVSIKKDKLHIMQDIFDLSEIKNIYVVGAGKATYPLARAVDEIIGNRITDGLIIVKDGQKGPLKHMRITESAHPFPDERGFRACEEVFEIADKAGENDIVICIITGGSSATCLYPAPGISFEDKLKLHRLLVCSGANITEINTVRRHLSSLKGGRLTLRILPATIIGLTVSDAVGDEMAINTDWISPDKTTLEDAAKILKKHDLWKKVSGRVRRYLSNPSPEKETPDNFEGNPLYLYMMVKSRTLCEAAAERARRLGLTPLLLTTSLEGESREVGRVLSTMAQEIHLSGNPAKPPCVLICGGETAVRIAEKVKGKGGANQELAVGACLTLNEEHPIVVSALDTDGTDGPTYLAGALTDGSTMKRAFEKGYDLYKILMEHDVAKVLTFIGDAINTGPTGTNVNDLALCIIL